MTAYKTYLKQLNAALTCSPKNRKKYIDDVLPLLDEFSQNNPDAKSEDFIREFGAPEELAASLLKSLDQEEISKFKNKRSKKQRSIIICIAAIILLIFSGLIWYIHLILTVHVDFEGESELIITDRTDPDGIYENAYKETECD